MFYAYTLIYLTQNYTKSSNNGKWVLSHFCIQISNPGKRIQSSLCKRSLRKQISPDIPSMRPNMFYPLFISWLEPSAVDADNVLVFFDWEVVVSIAPTEVLAIHYHFFIWPMELGSWEIGFVLIYSNVTNILPDIHFVSFIGSLFLIVLIILYLFLNHRTLICSCFSLSFSLS